MDTQKLKYLNDEDILDERETLPPLNRTVSGYGNKIPSSYQLKLKDKRWHRVYVICYSNIGTPYVISKGEKLYLGGISYSLGKQTRKMKHEY